MSALWWGLQFPGPWHGWQCPPSPLRRLSSWAEEHRNALTQPKKGERERWVFPNIGWRFALKILASYPFPLIAMQNTEIRKPTRALSSVPGSPLPRLTNSISTSHPTPQAAPNLTPRGSTANQLVPGPWPRPPHGNTCQLWEQS